MALQMEPQGMLFAEVSEPKSQFIYLVINVLKCFPQDQVPQPPHHAEAQAAAPAEDLPAAGQELDAPAGPDEHQRGHLGQAAQEEHQPQQECRGGPAEQPHQ